MERLTGKTKKCGLQMICRNEDCMTDEEYCPIMNMEDCFCLSEVLKKLKAYEDTGLTPEEIKLLLNPPETLYILNTEPEEQQIYKLHPVEGEQIEICGGFYWNCRDDFGDCNTIPLEGLGEGYFLTKEEAEEKLVEMEKIDD